MRKTRSQQGSLTENETKLAEGERCLQSAGASLQYQHTTTVHYTQAIYTRILHPMSRHVSNGRHPRRARSSSSLPIPESLSPPPPTVMRERESQKKDDTGSERRHEETERERKKMRRAVDGGVKRQARPQEARAIDGGCVKRTNEVCADVDERESGAWEHTTTGGRGRRRAASNTNDETIGIQHDDERKDS
ncbi:hypothetical protein EXIGLDRAFT_85509 [Exidia glandulosa HHB12029]|uniref:Uncharacterized protein n=1 Tax=Exidia glandulosa HHB12029 TaxID=1314781 RepID=A0A165HG60_EXIGL|nr:hypothetical protein EXIGLDRAFT_85509 [Exidia glandulosa HHB12029]